MARIYNRRRASAKDQLKAKPMEAIYAAAVSLASFVAYIVIVAMSVSYAGDSPNWVGGLGILGFFASICAGIYNAGQMQTKTEFKDRCICFGISIAVFLIWLVTFILGMIY